MMRIIPRPGMLTALVALCLAASVGRPQWVEDSIQVQGGWVSELAYNTAANVAYGALPYDSVIFAIDCATNQVVATIGGLLNPSFVKYDSVDNKGYCLFRGPDSLLVIDGSTHSRIRALRVGFAGSMLWAPDENRLYISRNTEDSVAVLDCTTDSVLYCIKVGMEPLYMWLSRRHRKLYVADNSNAAISVVDRNLGRAVASVPTGGGVNSGWYSESADRFYYAWGDLGVIDGAGDTALSDIYVPGSARLISEAPELGRLLVATNVNSGPDTVFAIDVATGTIVSRLLVPGGTPQSLKRSPATGLFYYAASRDSVSVISSDGLRVIANLRVGAWPSGLAFAPSQRRVYVSHNNSDRVYVLRDTIGVPGVAEMTKSVAQAEARRGTVVHGVLRIPVSPFTLHASLFDMAGRQVKVLIPGANDVSGLAPGVYFIREARAQAIRKVLLTK
jgi:YVTN family beta-propeller protein